jgi:hypothetical protein
MHSANNFGQSKVLVVGKRALFACLLAGGLASPAWAQSVSGGTATFSNGVSNQDDAGDVASGSGSTAGGGFSTANGTGSTASGGAATATGVNSTASGGGSTASGLDSTASGVASTATGTFSDASGVSSTATGANSAASGAGDIAAGANATTTRSGTQTNGNIAVGSDTSTVSGASSAVDTTANGGNSIAIGAGAQSTGNNSLALGAGSTDGGAANVLSVGAPGATRAITNVTAGAVAINSTDAVNGSQLYATNQNIGTVKKEAYQGVAAALASPSIPELSPGQKWVGLKMGAYGGQNALGGAFAYQVSTGADIGVTIAKGFQGGPVAVSAQLGYAW